VAAFARHLFICTNQRAAGDARGCCADKGSLAVAEAFKQRLHERGLKRIVRANKSGCLDQCARGVTVVVYPEGIWYGGVTLADVDEIIERHVIGGQVVERLRLAPAELTGRTPPPGVLEVPDLDPRQ
jgi:(2Fe-2S) ferredoxin